MLLQILLGLHLKMMRGSGRKEGSVPCPGQPELAYKGKSSALVTGFALAEGTHQQGTMCRQPTMASKRKVTISWASSTIVHTGFDQTSSSEPHRQLDGILGMMEKPTMHIMKSCMSSRRAGTSMLVPSAPESTAQTEGPRSKLWREGWNEPGVEAS